jgi:mono/diheme cytochrome c family protein
MPLGVLLLAAAALALAACGGGGDIGDAGGATTTVAGQSKQFGQPSVGGNAAAGKRVFVDAGCGDCHMLEEAGTSGRVGPSLDEQDLEFGDVVEQVRDGGGGMPAFRDKLSEQNIEDVSQFVVESSREDDGSSDDDGG